MEKEKKPPIVVLGLKDDPPPPTLRVLLAPLAKMGYCIIFDDRAPKADVGLLILGLDPGKHEVPEELTIQLRKLQKDFVLRYATEIKDTVYAKYLAESGFVPKMKIIKPKLIV